MDEDIGVLTVVYDKGAGLTVAQEYERQAVPVETVAVGAVEAVERRECGDFDTVFFVDGFHGGGIVELMEDGLIALTEVDHAHPAFDIPGHHVVERLAEGRCTQSLFLCGGAPDMERRKSAPDHTKGVEGGQVTPVVHMQMRQEDLVEIRVGHAEGVQVGA